MHIFVIRTRIRITCLFFVERCLQISIIKRLPNPRTLKVQPHFLQVLHGKTFGFVTREPCFSSWETLTNSLRSAPPLFLRYPFTEEKVSPFGQLYNMAMERRSLQTKFSNMWTCKRAFWDRTSSLLVIGLRCDASHAEPMFYQLQLVIYDVFPKPDILLDRKPVFHDIYQR